MNEEEFQAAVDLRMSNILGTCIAKVQRDIGETIDLVTERQIEHSLRNLPVSVRSDMIRRCFRHFGARKET